MVEWGRESETAEIYTQSEIRIFFVLLTGDWYRTTSRNWIILVSTHFSTFMSLVRAISRHWIIIDSPCFFAFVSLVQLKLSFTSQPWVVWRKACAQSSVTSCRSSVGLLHSLRSKSFLVYIISWTLKHSSWSHLLPTCCTWIHLLSRMLPTQRTWHFCRGNNCILFTFRNSLTSCYATHSTYVTCQRDLSR